MKLILTRHGQTIANANNILHGQKDSDLTDLGLKQAKRLAEVLRYENLDRIVTSDLGRAVKTAEEIRVYHPNTPFFKNEKIRERSYGEIEGRCRDEFKGQDYHSFPCTEPQESLMRRSQSFLRELSDYKNVLVVAHGGINLALVANILGISFQESLNSGPTKNASITLFDPCPNLRLFNYRGHLKGLL